MQMYNCEGTCNSGHLFVFIVYSDECFICTELVVFVVYMLFVVKYIHIEIYDSFYLLCVRMSGVEERISL